VTNIQAVGTVIRLLGLWLLLSWLQHLLQSFSLLMLPIEGRSMAFAIFVFWIALAAFMVARPIFLARIILPSDGAASPGREKPGWSIDELQAALFSGVGLYLLASVLFDASRWIHSGLALAQKTPLWQLWNFLPVEEFILLILKCIVGTWLLVGAKGLRGAIRLLRGSGE